MKKTISLLTVLAVLVSLFTVFASVAYAADIPNIVVSGPEKTQNATNNRTLVSTWYSVNGYPSWDDIVAIGDGNRVKGPPADKYLTEYLPRYINAPKGNHVYVFRSAGSTRDPEMIEHGARVYVIAESGNASFVIYRTLNNVPRSGWVNTNALSDSYPGYTVSIGAEPDMFAVNVGDPSTTWSRDNMSGTRSKYLILDEPIENCVGFTLEYRAQYKDYEDCSGTRNLYINDGTGWYYVGKFPYETAKSYHVVVNLNAPTTIYAVATPLEVERDKAFSVRTSLLDVLVER